MTGSIFAEFIAAKFDSLHIPEQAILTLNEEKILGLINNIFSEKNENTAYSFEKRIEPLEEIKRLQTDNKVLYERLLRRDEELIEALKAQRV